MCYAALHEWISAVERGDAMANSKVWTTTEIGCVQQCDSGWQSMVAAVIYAAKLCVVARTMEPVLVVRRVAAGPVLKRGELSWVELNERKGGSL